MRASTRRWLAAGLLGVIIGVVQVALAQSANPHLGTWKLNVAKSKYSPGTATKSGTLKIEAAGAGIKFTVDTVGADGTVRHYVYSANFDGKDYPVAGNSANGDVVALTQVDANTMRTVNMKDGKVTVTQSSVVSGDQKTRTITSKGTNLLGQTVDNVGVWERQ
jgi:hypothetical protein